jgi:hypothetical protein
MLRVGRTSSSTITTLLRIAAGRPASGEFRDGPLDRPDDRLGIEWRRLRGRSVRRLILDAQNSDVLLQVGILCWIGADESQAAAQQLDVSRRTGQE